jgi:hypothetical protein
LHVRSIEQSSSGDTTKYKVGAKTDLYIGLSVAILFMSVTADKLKQKTP